VGQWTFLFACVEGCAGSEAARVREVVGDFGGSCAAGAGGDVWAAFPDAAAAVQAARVVQRANVGLAPAVAVHTGPARSGADGFHGAGVEVAALILDATHRGQTLVSGTARRAAGAAAGTVVDLGYFQLGELIEPIELVCLVEGGGADRSRPPQARRLTVGDVPRPASSLIGRDDEVEAVLELLTRARIVTLTGVGGIGKTRLALEVARRADRRTRDGTWVARLETATSADDVLAALLGAVGVERSGARRGLDALLEGLRHRDAMVVLDNCEHVVDAVSDVVTAIVQSAADVRILAASREPLDVDGEHVVGVPPLDTSDAGAALALFVDRAAAAGANVDLGLDGTDVAAICRRLEGIPLAIELAAARCRSMRPCDLVERMDDMFSVLRPGRRDAPRRHRSMLDALTWSYDLLAPDERRLLARSSVFAGSFGIEAAAAVCADDALHREAVLACLDRLVARSLVVSVDGGHGSRFRLLEPVRQFARGQLEEMGDGDHIRERHTRWYVDLITDLGARWRGGDDQGTWPIAAEELPNLRLAFDHLVERRRIDDAERFVVDAFGPVDNHFDVVPEREWAPRALAIDPRHVGPWTASTCGVAVFGSTDPADPAPATAWIRRGEAAIRRGSVDDGVLLAAAMHQVLFRCPLSTTPGFVQTSVERAAASSDLHRQVWVYAYTARGELALRAAERLGNVMLIAFARLSLARSIADGSGSDAEWEAIESFWDAAQGSNCSVLLNHAGQMVGDARIRAGAVVDGLLLLRAPLRDWYLQGDPRVWDVLRSIATGLAAAGDAVGAARLMGAIGERGMTFTTAGPVDDTNARIDAAIAATDRQRHAREGRRLGLGAVVAEALERVDGRARLVGTHAPSGIALTGRQREIADLVAKGLTNKQIARAMDISRFTVETHVRNILERLGAASRAQIAAWAVSTAGVIERPRT
jgi:non-specific serine/threonine protein kinase